MRKENRQLEEDLGKARTDVEVGKASLQRSDAELETLRARQEATRKELEAIRTEFENYKRDFHLQSRLRAVGQKYAELATIEGKTYKDVTIRAVLGDTIQFKHADGTARLPIASLGRSWVKRFDVAPAPPVCSIDDEHPARGLRPGREGTVIPATA